MVLGGAGLRVRFSIDQQHRPAQRFETRGSRLAKTGEEKGRDREYASFASPATIPAHVLTNAWCHPTGGPARCFLSEMILRLNYQSFRTSDVGDRSKLRDEARLHMHENKKIESSAEQGLEKFKCVSV